MSYKAVLRASLTRTIQSWVLPDSVFVEVHLRLHRLSKSPAEQLVRVRKPFEGMIFAFDFIDPINRLCEHVFAFKIMYGQDEVRLHVVRGQYVRRYA